MNDGNENITRAAWARIKQLRVWQGMGQEQFANHIDISRTYFAELETGRRNVSIRNLAKMADGLGASLAESFDSELFD